MRTGESYRSYRETNAWKAKRKAVLQAANYRCEKCGKPAIDVHHKTYKRIYYEPLSDLIALCRECHRAIHKK